MMIGAFVVAKQMQALICQAEPCGTELPKVDISQKLQGEEVSSISDNQCAHYHHNLVKKALKVVRQQYCGRRSGGRQGRKGMVGMMVVVGFCKYRLTLRRAGAGCVQVMSSPHCGRRPAPYPESRRGLPARKQIPEAFDRLQQKVHQNLVCRFIHLVQIACVPRLLITEVNFFYEGRIFCYVERVQYCVGQLHGEETMAAHALLVTRHSVVGGDDALHRCSRSSLINRYCDDLTLF